MDEPQAYRTACEACKARELAESRMLPFQKQWTCPECTSTMVTHWGKVCRGSGRFVVAAATGMWWWKKPGVFFECTIGDSPKHIHMQCKRCNNRWEMLTATETPAATDAGGRQAPPEPGTRE